MRVEPGTNVPSRGCRGSQKSGAWCGLEKSQAERVVLFVPARRLLSSHLPSPNLDIVPFLAPRLYGLSFGDFPANAGFVSSHNICFSLDTQSPSTSYNTRAHREHYSNRLALFLVDASAIFYHLHSLVTSFSLSLYRPHLRRSTAFSHPL
ncbi:hypothetical protein L209DRAFT_747102 [Thermothelomyces heterothallicus CBS 203.75]